MKKAPKGFTVVEVMIFLAISGTMFTIAFLGSRAQIKNVSFRQGLNSVELKIREIFNNVDNGYFGNAGDYKCTARALNGADWVVVEAGGGGNSSSCVYMGKIISFTNSGQELTIKNLLGSRLNANIQTVSSGASET